MSVSEVFIHKTPFMTMIVSAVEVYPKECLGVLFGYKTQRTAIVEQAFIKLLKELEPQWKLKKGVKCAVETC